MEVWNGNVAIDNLYTTTTPSTRHKLLDLSVKFNKGGFHLRGQKIFEANLVFVLYRSMQHKLW